jgi:hypothetical protein
MLNWFKKEKSKEYKSNLLKAFPQSLQDDVKAVLDILPFSTTDIKLADGQTHAVTELIDSTTLSILLKGEPLTIPYRIYLNEPAKENEAKLSPTQFTILHCIYLKHCDGHVRQRRLEQLIDVADYWVTPFTLQLLGEYVYELLPLLNKHVNEKTLASYRDLVNENPDYWQKTKSRMISYWNAYYRGTFPKLNGYLGQIIADKIS